jgi:hypothetical protein
MPETHFSMIVKARKKTDSMNVPTSIETKQSNRLGFMEGEGSIPDDFNTMGAKEIENLFVNSR